MLWKTKFSCESQAESCATLDTEKKTCNLLGSCQCCTSFASTEVKDDQKTHQTTKVQHQLGMIKKKKILFYFFLPRTCAQYMQLHSVKFDPHCILSLAQARMNIRGARNNDVKHWISLSVESTSFTESKAELWRPGGKSAFFKYFQNWDIIKSLWPHASAKLSSS